MLVLAYDRPNVESIFTRRVAMLLVGGGYEHDDLVCHVKQSGKIGRLWFINESVVIPFPDFGDIWVDRGTQLTITGPRISIEVLNRFQ